MWFVRETRVKIPLGTLPRVRLWPVISYGALGIPWFSLLLSQDLRLVGTTHASATLLSPAATRCSHGKFRRTPVAANSDYTSIITIHLPKTSNPICVFVAYQRESDWITGRRLWRSGVYYRIVSLLDLTV